MYYIIEENVSKKEDLLIRFKGFIPFDFYPYIDMLERNKFLKSINLFNKIDEENLIVRNSIKSDDNNQYSEKVMKKWLVENPQFKDLVEFK